MAAFVTVMNLMHVIAGLGVGGAETALHRFVGMSTDRGVSHHVVSLGADTAMLPRFEEIAATVTEVNWRPGLQLPREVGRLRQIARDLQPDLVVGWMYHGNLAAHFAAQAVDRPQVWNIRQSLYDISEEKWLTRAVIWAGRLLSNRPAAIVYNSETSARHHQDFGFSRKNSRVIPNGFDTMLFKPDPVARARIRRELELRDDDIVVACVARFHPVKNHRTLILAAAEVLKRHERAKLLLVGLDVSRENANLVQQIDGLSIRDSVILCGVRNDIHAVYAAVDVAVSSSLAESFPNSIAEAMSAGVYCVATDVGDSRHILARTGVVVPPGDAAALSRALMTAVEIGEGARKEMGLAARKRIQSNYALGTMTERFHDLFTGAASRDYPCAE